MSAFSELDVRGEIAAAVDRHLREASSGGDHFYGAWTGGSEKSGGHPTAIPTGKRDATEPKALGGSTGARLVQVDGQPYVEKKGASAGHVREEVTANEMYDAAGVPVPARALIEGPSGPVMRAQFVGGTQLNNYMSDPKIPAADKAVVRENLQKGFAADVLFGNYDVVGPLDGANVIVDHNRVPWRIDNGGSLRYRAQGELKGEAQFGKDPMGSLARMSDPSRGSWTTEMFKGIPPADLRKQVQELDSRRAAILKATPAELRDTIGARLDAMLAATK